MVGQPASDALVRVVEARLQRELGRLDRAGRQDHAAGAEGPLLVGEQVMGGHPDHALRVGLVDQDLPDGVVQVDGRPAGAAGRLHELVLHQQVGGGEHPAGDRQRRVALVLHRHRSVEMIEVGQRLGQEPLGVLLIGRPCRADPVEGVLGEPEAGGQQVVAHLARPGLELPGPHPGDQAAPEHRPAAQVERLPAGERGTIHVDVVGEREIREEPPDALVETPDAKAAWQVGHVGGEQIRTSLEHQHVGPEVGELVGQDAAADPRAHHQHLVLVGLVEVALEQCPLDLCVLGHQGRNRLEQDRIVPKS